MARLNDTKSLVASNGMGVEHSVSTRKIDNGFIVCESTCNPSTGEYRRSERFMRDPPKVVPAKVVRGGREPSQTLADTMNYLGRGR